MSGLVCDIILLQGSPYGPPNLISRLDYGIFSDACIILENYYRSYLGTFVHVYTETFVVKGVLHTLLRSMRLQMYVGWRPFT